MGGERKSQSHIVVVGETRGRKEVLLRCALVGFSDNTHSAHTTRQQQTTGGGFEHGEEEEEEALASRDGMWPG